ncbi:titin-like [Sitophilus oryzae]|uniref:Titin-like n=1 Tax=Sitophilus oryzae TaxID=7048 RepID=A0A6J2XU16_SITOR|nr:titin-like [Sitophilus oryzae]
MFFNIILLHPQHKMRFALPWRAATLGISRLSNYDVRKCDIVALCNCINEFVTNNSLNPKKRFSLRLSSILIHGVCLIYKKQVLLLQVEIDKIIRNREIALNQYGETLPKPKAKPRTKITKKKPDAETPQSLERVLQTRSIRQPDVQPFNLEPLQITELPPESDAILQARAGEITIREEMPRTQEMYRLDDDFNLLEVDMRPIERGIPEPLPMEVPQVPPQELAEIEPPVVPLKEAAILLEEPQIEIPVPAPLEVDVSVAPQEPVVQMVQEEPPVVLPQRDEDIAVVPQEPEVPAVQAEPPLVVPPQTPVRAEPIRHPGQVLLLPRKAAFVLINKPPELFPERLPVDLNFKVPKFARIEEFWPREDVSLSAIDVARGPEEVESLRTSGTPLTIRSEGRTITPLIDTPSFQGIGARSSEIASEPPVESRKRPRETITEMFPPAAEAIEPPRHLDVTPRKRPKIVTIEEVKADEHIAHPPMEDISFIQPLELFETTKRPPTPPAVEAFTEKWSDEIMKVILKVQVKIKPVDICKEMGKRITKQSMARIFAALLVLAKGRYVILNSENGSCELEFVERGVRKYHF